MTFPASTGGNYARPISWIHRFPGEIENGSLKEVQITGQCHLLGLEDDDGGGDDFQKTQRT